MIRLAIFMTLLACAPARADFVLSNLRFTLYHEVGHAVIDQLNVPLFGPEENAADTFGLVLADRLHSEAEMAQIIQDMTKLGRIEARGELFDPWNEYMPGPQRLARAVCLYYGLNPGPREPLARALGMPSDMAGSCEDLSTVIARSWGDVLDRAVPTGNGAGSFQPAIRGKALRLLEADLARLNAAVALPRKVPVEYENCGQDNAFYYHYDERIVICAEMVDALQERARR